MGLNLDSFALNLFLFRSEHAKLASPLLEVNSIDSYLDPKIQRLSSNKGCNSSSSKVWGVG